jgi:hypothetical protein
MKKYGFFILVLLCFLGISQACSSSQESTMETNDLAVQEMDIAEESTFIEENKNDVGKDMQENKIQENVEIPKDERKIIYNAHLQVEVKHLDQSFTDIEAQLEILDGYIVDSMMQGFNSEVERSGHITVRVPQESLHEFMEFVEGKSSNVLESSISGQDVTEEHVDLQSKLKSKIMVEERLLSFIEKAEKTEELLAISNDLAKVQEQIEGIKGRMQYLENKSDLATVTIYLQEKNVSLSGINDDKQNTWEKTKEQLIKSIQLLVMFLSNLFVFLVGNLPIFLLVGMVFLIIYFIYRKRKKKDKAD